MNTLIEHIFGEGTLIFKGVGIVHAILIFLGLAGLLALSWYIQRKQGKRGIRTICTFLRLLAVALVLFVLMEPVLRDRELIPQQTFLVHLFDTSESMNIEDYEKMPRISAVNINAASGAPKRKKVNELFRTLEFSFDETVESRNLTDRLLAREKATDLVSAFRGLRFQISGLPVTGVVYYSDGNPTLNLDRQEILDAAARLEVPLYTVGCAPVEPGPDFWVEKVIYPDEVVNSAVTKITGLIGARGMKGDRVQVSLIEGEDVIKTQNLYSVSDDQVMRAEFSIRPTGVGLRHYQVKAEFPGIESYPWNNENDFFINVVKKERRLLYAEGHPRYEYRFLRAAFEDDERFQVASFVFVTDKNNIYRQGIKTKTELLKGFPEDKEELFSYDVVVLGNVSASKFNEKQLNALREFVRTRGGGVLFLAGADSFDPNGFQNTPVADILPFRFAITKPALEGEYKVYPTIAGTERGIFGPYSKVNNKKAPWEALPAVKGLYPLNDLKPGATALCEIDMSEGRKNLPVIAHHRYGRGACLVCGISATWQWKFQTPSDDPTYQAFWKEMTLILLEGLQKRITLKATPPIVPLGSEVTLEGMTLDKEFNPDPTVPVMLRIESPSGEVATIRATSKHGENATFRHTMAFPEAGTYKATARAAFDEGMAATKEEEAEAMFIVKEEVSPELREVRLNENLLREIASMTRGKYVHLSHYEELPDLIVPKEGSLQKVKERSIWDNAWIFLMIIGLLLVEWLIRRLGGLA